MSLNRCSVFDRLPKKTLLAWLGSKQVKLLPKNSFVTYTNTLGVVKRYQVVADFGDTVKVTDGVETFEIPKSEAITGNEIFLDKFDNWNISSYDGKRREVCVAITGKVPVTVIYSI